MRQLLEKSKAAGKDRLVFAGSMTNTSFRARMPEVSKLATDFKDKIDLTVIYTLEAHPSDGWKLAA
jgi:hypothetical protein